MTLFMDLKVQKIAILGAGSWGTAIALHLANHGYLVNLWSHNAIHVHKMQKDQQNKPYLPDIHFPRNLTPCVSYEKAITNVDFVLIAVPSHAFAKILNQLLQPPKLGIAWLTKGLDPATHLLLHELIKAKWGQNYPIAVISGPSFAKEVAKSLPTAIVVAGNDPGYFTKVRDLLHHGNMRVYTSDDYIGVQICGAVKNVLAIACGISDGLNYGANAKAALITRGLAEMTRLGISLGAKIETFLGLAGVGDLVLTCTDNQSRNRRYGLLIGQGKSLAAAEQDIGQVVEGKYNAKQICQLAQEQQVEMPICTVVNEILQGKVSAQEAVIQLMQRPVKHEYIS